MLGVCLALIDDEEDKNKFEELYRLYEQDMYAIAYDILRNEADAEDVVNQSFFKIANNFTKISSISCHEIKAYIVIVCRNTALNIYKQNKRRAERITPFNDEIVDDNYFQNCEIEILEEAIRKLPQEYKDVLYLYCLQGFSSKETAKLLNISAETVRQRSLRAKKMLKDFMERNE